MRSRVTLLFLLAGAPVLLESPLLLGEEGVVNEFYNMSGHQRLSCTNGLPGCELFQCAPLAVNGVPEDLVKGERIFFLQKEVNGKIERRVVSNRWNETTRAFEWQEAKPRGQFFRDPTKNRVFDDDGGEVHRFGDPMDTSETELLTSLLTQPVSEVGCKDFTLKATFLESIKALGKSDLNKTSNLLAEALRAVDQEPVRASCPKVAPELFKLHAITTIKDPETSEKLPVTVLSPAEAEREFQKLAASVDIPFNYPEEGCHARAHEMSWLLEQDGIISVKAFVEGDLRVKTSHSPKGFVKWGSHVAPVVMVDSPGGPVPTVFDPSLFDHPVSVQVWKDAMDPSRKATLSYGKRYMMFPKNDRDLKDWGFWLNVARGDLRYYRTVVAARDEEWRRSKYAAPQQQ